MNFNFSVAMIFGACCALSTSAASEIVYRCGTVYSQKPCADGVSIEVQDARTLEQKSEADASTRKQSATANAMEASRLKVEAQQRADNAKFAAALARQTKPKPKDKRKSKSTARAKTEKPPATATSTHSKNTRKRAASDKS
jgi:hypothetical protein